MKGFFRRAPHIQDTNLTGQVQLLNLRRRVVMEAMETVCYHRGRDVGDTVWVRRKRMASKVALAECCRELPKRLFYLHVCELNWGTDTEPSYKNTVLSLTSASSRYLPLQRRLWGYLPPLSIRRKAVCLSAPLFSSLFPSSFFLSRYGGKISSFEHRVRRGKLARLEGWIFD